MNVSNAIDNALEFALAHTAGQRDATLPDYVDAQVHRFISTLRMMKSSLADPTSCEVPSRYMAMAIADGWPFESRLGKLICEAEEYYHARVAGRL